jgi:hypothetical protein
MLIVQMAFSALAVLSAVFVLVYRKKALREANSKLAEYKSFDHYVVQSIPAGEYTDRNHTQIIEARDGATLRFDWRLERWFLEDGTGLVHSTNDVLGFYPLQGAENPYVLVDGVD